METNKKNSNVPDYDVGHFAAFYLTLFKTGYESFNML